MTISKTITAGVAAAALVGAIGLAYAQTTDSAAPQGGGTAAADPQSPNNAGTMQPAQPAMPAAPRDTSAAPAAAPSSTDTMNTPAPAQRAAQPDRN